jgi:hypothetical protein
MSPNYLWLHLLNNWHKYGVVFLFAKEFRLLFYISKVWGETEQFTKKLLVSLFSRESD